MNDNWVLILGANSDIARWTARRFAKEGYNIYLASRNTENLQNEAGHLNLKYGIKAESIYFDALNFNSHEDFYNRLSPKPAGSIIAFGLLGDQIKGQNSMVEAKKIIDTNYISAVSILEIICADYENRKSGFIVGISSVAGDRGRKSNYIYGSSKSGLSAYLSGLRHRMFKSGVNVLTVKPGFVATKMTFGLDLPEKLTAQPQEVGDQIFKAVKKGKNTIYVKPIWRWIMYIIIHIPEFIFKKTQL